MAVLCAAERWLFPLGFGGQCEAKALAWWLKLLSQGFAPRLRAWELCRSSAASAGARRGRRGGTRVPAVGMPRGHPGGWPVPARAPAPPQPARGQWGKQLGQHTDYAVLEGKVNGWTRFCVQAWALGSCEAPIKKNPSVQSMPPWGPVGRSAAPRLLVCWACHQLTDRPPRGQSVG